jgi:copper chaperone CopZ
MGKEYLVEIDGMMCNMCEAHVSDAIRRKFSEAKEIKADHTKGTVFFELDNPLPPPMLKKELKDAISPLGYKVLSVK